MKIDGDDGRFVYAAWSRSGKRVALSVGATWHEMEQVELTPDQAQALARFLNAGPDGV